MNSMRSKHLILLAIAGLMFGAMTFPGRTYAQPLNAAKVRKAIEKGVRYLKDRQKGNGSWQGMAGHRDASTALITLALLNSGVSANDQTIVRALKRLDQFDQRSLETYAVSLRIMAYCAANPKKYIDRIQKDVRWLERTQNTTNNQNHGGWSYSPLNKGSGDGSNAQFALLALHEARLAGVKVNPSVWRNAKIYWDRLYVPTNGQPNQGGFRYTTTKGSGPTDGVRGSMTCAGISSLIIIHENLVTEMIGNNLDIQCCGGNMRPESIDKAINWMGDDLHFRVTGNPFFSSYRNGSFHGGTKFYFLYGLERAGRLAGIRFFGKHDWYREGAEHLLKIQNAGFWRGERVSMEDNPEIATALALLFLSKGKRPVVIGKYKYGKGNNWDLHPRGVHYLNRAIETAKKTKFNWQVINGNDATVDDLLEAPVLFISGRDEIKLTKKQKTALKEYIDNGGFIFAEACQGDGCGDEVPFDRSFRMLMKEILPNSSFENLPMSHPIWRAFYQLKKPTESRPVLGIQASCRTSVIYVPQNLAGLWQLNQPGWFEKHNDEAKADIDYTTKLGVNVIAYATGWDVKEKGERPKVKIDSKKILGSRILEIPKLKHGGGSDDAPNAWRNVMSRFQFDRKRPVKLEKNFVAAKLDELQNYPIVFMHGRNGFKFTGKERDAIREYVNRGGFIFADAICSSPKFAESFRKEMKEIFPAEKLEAIPKKDSIWQSKSYDGYDIQTVTLRTPIANDRGKSFRQTKTHPLLEGLKVKGRYAVVFSRHDLSCAMENASGSQCKGYSKDDAAKIGVNVILYALLEIPRESK